MEQLKKALIESLTAAGLAAQSRFPNGPMPRLKKAEVAVELQSLQAAKSGLGDYLGLLEKEDGTNYECYGKRIAGTALLRIYAPTALLAEEAAHRALQALEKADLDFTVEELSLEATEFNALTDCYVRDVLLRFSAYFYILSQDGDGMFYDFRLEGELQCV